VRAVEERNEEGEEGTKKIEEEKKDELHSKSGMV